VIRRLLVSAALAGAGALAARGAWEALRKYPPGGAALWERMNHRGETLTLLEGPAYTLGAAAVTVLAPGVPPRAKAAAVVATVGGGVFGAIDDLRETGKSKGLRGHLGELAHGNVTTGGLKVLGIGATGLVTALLLPGPQQRLVGRAGDTLLSGVVVAGSANLMNLFDLRPGRAIKVMLLFAPFATKSPLVAVACGAGAGLLPIDLAEKAMLGDTGANAAGALLGTAAVTGLGRKGRLAVLAVVGGLTLASEKVSFTKVIARTPVLRELDQLGRRPAAQ
jgi:UDP-N-acetylmuramyl pentapeptide phosphotransferase/UDP-N-acetylglucosamine-1-phosphate transferase